MGRVQGTGIATGTVDPSYINRAFTAGARTRDDMVGEFVLFAGWLNPNAADESRSWEIPKRTALYEGAGVWYGACRTLANPTGLS